MKKELLAGALLAILFALSLWNVRKLDRVAEEIAKIVEETEAQALSGDWESAEDAARRAIGLWQSVSVYTRSTLKHSDIDGVEEALYRLLECVCRRDAGSVRVTTEYVREVLRSMTETERLKIENIF